MNWYYVQCQGYENIQNTVSDIAKIKLVGNWFQQYCEFKWDNMMPLKRDAGRAYIATYKDIKGSR